MRAKKLRLVYWLGLLCTILLNAEGQAGTCLHLTGTVMDYGSQQPLQANLFIKLATGRIAAGRSAAGSGTFVLDVDCQALSLIIEQTGYLSQQISLTALAPVTAGKTVGIIVPLIALANQTTNQVYQQAAQTHYEQQTTPVTGKGQPGLFLVTDALTNQAVQAKVCLYPTNGMPVRCLDTDGRGQVQTLFAQQDIIAVEVQAIGYVTYQGNITVEQLDGQQRRHTVRLVRELVLLTVTSPSARKGMSYFVQTGTNRSPIALQQVPGLAGQYCTYKLTPGTYRLLVRDVSGKTNTVPQIVRVRNGLNVVTDESTSSSSQDKPVARVTIPPMSVSGPATSQPTPLRPDELPLIYFDQGSYLLNADARTVLQQVATFMQAHPEYRLKLIGHTDLEGDRQMNRYLSEFRAKMIANYLFWQGIPDSRMSISGQGSQYPVAASDSEDNKAKNRRVFLKLEPANE